MAVGVFGGHQVLGLLRVHKSELEYSDVQTRLVTEYSHTLYQHYSDMTARSIHLEVVRVRLFLWMPKGISLQIICEPNQIFVVRTD